MLDTRDDLKVAATGDNWLVLIVRLSRWLSADTLDERSNRFRIAHAFVYFVRFKLSGGVPVSHQDLRPWKCRPNTAQQELELGRSYGTNRDQDDGIRGSVGLNLGGRTNSGQSPEGWTPGNDAAIEPDSFGD